MNEKQGFIYMLMNEKNTVVYTGVTSNLQKRIFEHKQKLIDGFSKKYNLNKLVYFEQFSDIKDAISREKQIKVSNPSFQDLYAQL